LPAASSGKPGFQAISQRCPSVRISHIGSIPAPDLFLGRLDHRPAKEPHGLHHAVHLRALSDVVGQRDGSGLGGRRNRDAGIRRQIAYRVQGEPDAAELEEGYALGSLQRPFPAQPLIEGDGTLEVSYPNGHQAQPLLDHEVPASRVHGTGAGGFRKGKRARDGLRNPGKACQQVGVTYRS
jgi:hypothetical protein